MDNEKEPRNRIAEGIRWNRPEIITAFPSLEIYEAVKNLSLGYGGYNEPTQTMRGSNTFIAARIDTILREEGIGRVANLRDLSRPEVLSMIKDKYYSDIPAFIARSHNDSNPENQPLLDQIISAVEERQGRVKFPFMVSGFDCQNPYEIIPRLDFSVIEDERFDGKYSGSKFNGVDDKGIPLFEKKGNRIWYARSEGLSRLDVGGYLDLGSDDDDLDFSDDVGRVVLISGEADAQNFEAQLRNSFESEQTALNKRYEEALQILRGNNK